MPPFSWSNSKQHKVLAMDGAVEELKYTIEQASEYFKSSTHHLEELQCHVTALKEDADIVEHSKTGDRTQDKDAEEVVRTARRLRRDLEKLSFPLLREREAIKLQVQRDELEVQKQAYRRMETAAAIPSNEKKVSAIKLPTLKLPIFSGEIEQYRGFKQVFLDLVNEDPGMSPMKKWLLLKEHLGGKALEIVQELPSSPETFQVAIDLLDQAFGSVNKAVTHLYHRLQGLPVATMRGDSLRLTHAKLDGMLRSLESMGEDVDTSRFLRTVVINKFPKELFSILRITDDMDLPKFRKRIAGYIQSSENSLETLPAIQNQDSSSGPNKDSANRNNRFRKNQERSAQSNESEKRELSSTSGSSAASEPPPAKKPATRSRKCTFCGEAHFSDVCETYKTLEQRLKKISDKCIKCLRPLHAGKECARVVKCFHCGDVAHNRAVCPKQCGAGEKVCHIKDVFADEGAVEGARGFNGVTTEVLNAEYVTFMLDAASSAQAERIEKIRALLDTASRRTLIKRSLVHRLQLKENRDNCVKILGVANVSVSDVAHPTCKIFLHPPNHQPILIEAVIMEHLVEDVRAPSVQEFRQRYPQFAQLPIPDEGNGEEVELLIGTRSLVPILTLQNSIIVSRTVHLLSTKFGWIVFGGLEDTQEDEERSVATLVIQEIDPVKMMCSLELVGLKGMQRDKNEEEAVALDKFYQTLEFLEERRYECGIPFRYDPPDLEDNFGLAWGRLVSLWKKLKTTPEFLVAYDSLIKGQELGRIIEKVIEKTKPKHLVHYIAHQAVVRTDKSTPVRFVVDASAHVAGKRSLNDNILKGANWVDDLPSLLIRFRKEPIAVTADVEKAFLQLSIREKDRDICRFLWLKDFNKPPTKDNLQVYRFRRVAFGIASSPFLLYATIKFHLRKNPHQFTDVLERDIYADNLVTSLPENVDLKAFYETVKETFSSMSMNLTKWVSNSSTFRQLIPESDQDKQTFQTVLGLLWNFISDRMSIHVKPAAFANQTQLTKRRVLKEAATIFDPLGWAMPIVLLARMFIRRIWKENYSWDQPLTEELSREWQKIRCALLDIRNIELNRRMFTCPKANLSTEWELHAFSDASIEAFAVVVFIKSGGHLAFVAAKSRLTPSRKLSVPRLELVAAVLASRYIQYVQKALNLEQFHKVTLWSDSKCILSWLRTTKILPAYVQKSVTEIKSCQIHNFYYVPTDLNPADVATRGADFQSLKGMNWWNGPSWLSDESNWPEQNISCEENTSDNAALQVNEEEKILLTKIRLAANKFNPSEYSSSPFALDPAKFSSFERLLKRSAFILHGINRIFLARIGRKALPVDNEKTDYQFVRIIWLLWDQKRAYTEIPSNKRSNVAFLRNMNVFQDQHNLYRCITRLQNSEKDEETIYPILLVKDSPITTLIVMSIHVNNLHSGTTYTLAALRRTYWLPSGRQQVFKIIKQNCAVCKKHTAKPYAAPEMAPLPEFRIRKTETPFRNVGLDIFGPIKTRLPSEPKKLQKRWVVIFTCLIIRAIHLELIEDMTTFEIFHAFRRFFARRGVPENIVSDNAPQFHVVERRFVSVWHYVAEKPEIVNYFAKKEIKWKFIPAHSPWMGGVYERLIKSVKDAFEKAYANLVMSDKQLTTVLVEIEAMLNARPISYVDRNIDTPIITPNHFLSLQFPAIPVNFENQPEDNISELWKSAENFLNTYWKRWADNYLLALRERTDDMKDKHLVEKREPKVGELVLMVEPSSRRSTWRRAIVERLITSEDNKIRSAQIKVSNGGRMIRPITKLLPLDLLTDVPEAERMQLNQSRTGLIHSLGESVDSTDVPNSDETNSEET